MNIASILNLKFQGIIKALIKFKAIQGFALNVQALPRIDRWIIHIVRDNRFMTARQIKIEIFVRFDGCLVSEQVIRSRIKVIGLGSRVPRRLPLVKKDNKKKLVIPLNTRGTSINPIINLES